MTKDEATMIGQAIRDAASIVPTPLENETERRAFCLKMAIETRSGTFPATSTATEGAADVLIAAKMYDDFLLNRSDQ